MRVNVCVCMWLGVRVCVRARTRACVWVCACAYMCVRATGQGPYFSKHVAFRFSMMPVTTCAAQVLLTRFTASTKRQVHFDDEGLHIPLFSVEYQLPPAAVKYEEGRVQRCGGSRCNSGSKGD